MDKKTLDAWLCGPDVPLPSPAAIASALGLPVRELADTTLLRTARHLGSLRFTLAVLRDIYADDTDVRRWLYTRHPEAGGVRPVHLILAGRTAAVEELAVRAWNDALTFDNSIDTVLSDV